MYVSDKSYVILFDSLDYYGYITEPQPDLQLYDSSSQ